MREHGVSRAVLLGFSDGANIAMKFAREVSYSSDAESLSLSELMNKYQAMSESLIANDNTMGVGVLFVGGEGGHSDSQPLARLPLHVHRLHRCAAVDSR